MRKLLPQFRVRIGSIVIAFTLFHGGAPLFAEEMEKTRVSTPEEESLSETPFTRYGVFEEEDKEEEVTRFLQSGRLLGVSVGLGLETADGNRGRLWQTGFPAFDVAVTYWFDFHWSLNLGLFFTSHSYLRSRGGFPDKISVRMLRYGLDFKYQLDTHNLAAPITFMSPFFLIGGHNYSVTQRSAADGIIDGADNTFGFCLGTGFEFTLVPRSTYLQLEGKVHFVGFKDNDSTQFANDRINDIADVSGRLYTILAKLLFTW